MGQNEKLLIKILSGTNDNSFRFAELQRLLEILGFNCRIRGDHFIYTMDGIEEIINLQPNGNKAKSYQVKQVRNLILKYTLGGNLLCINMK